MATIIRGADFRAKSIDALTIEVSDKTEHAAPACEARATDHPPVRDGAHDQVTPPQAQLANSPGGLDQRFLPYCDIRVLQDAERRTARFAESIAVLADRAGDAGLKRYLALIAESHVEEAKLLREMTVAGLAAKGGAA